MGKINTDYKRELIKNLGLTFLGEQTVGRSARCKRSAARAVAELLCSFSIYIYFIGLLFLALQ